jgi:NAD(P)H-dependent FMN reductase
MRVLGISGSLRAASLNSALLRTAARLAPAGMQLVLHDLGGLPLFNPDLEVQVPVPVLALRRAVDAADALLIATPEYARGVSGIIKNALDWLVSHEGFVGKPVALLNASPRAHHAQAALRETLRTMSALILEEASVAIPLLGSGLEEAAMRDSPAVAVPLTRALSALATAHAGATAQGPAFPLP